MKVLLIIPPTDLKKSYGKLRKFLNPQPSIGIAYIAAVLRKNGYDVKITDAYVDENGIEEIMDAVKEYSPGVIGISVLTASADVVYEISKTIRARFPYIKIVMGNIHASLFSDEILSKGYADFIVHREGELTMLEILRMLETGGDAEDIKGVSFKKEGTAVHNPMRPFIAELDDLPYPAWDLFPLDKYSTDPRSELKRGAVPMELLVTRGCPFQCTFCSSREDRSLGSRYRMRDPKTVVNEMVYMYERYGKDTFAFMDLAFPLVKEHAYGLCDEIINRGYGERFIWHTECRVTPLDQELLFHMRKAGCVRLYLGIESGNDETLKALKKNCTTEDARNAVKMAHGAGMEVDGMFMIGLPGETEEMIEKTVDFAIELDVRYAIFNLFVP
ncbi:MAG: cobalamin-dependent protein [Candidatus Omnitrophica bacterium]|nr:cobalamin-dependent protein [Candidatus Omnitrophota bacterium]